MGAWVQIGEKRYEAVPLERLTLLQIAQASKETGLTPRRMEQVMRMGKQGGETLEDEVDQLATSAVAVWAARVAAGESWPTVASAQPQMADLEWISDDEEEEGEQEDADPTTLPDPTPPDSGSGAGDVGEGSPQTSGD